MKKTVLTSLLASAALLALCAFAGGVAAAQKGTGAATTITTQSYPGGVYGYVSSPAGKRCTSDRSVEILEDRGDGDGQGHGSLVATVRSEAPWGNSYQWSAKTGAGRFSVRVPARSGCAEALGGVVSAQTLGALEGASEESSYPPCSPYVAEGTTEVCDLGMLSFDFKEESFLYTCSFSDSKGNCPGQASGVFPWGAIDSGQRPGARLYWNPISGGRKVDIVSFHGLDADGDGAAFLSGTMAGSSDDKFKIGDAWAQNELGGANGQHFKTLSLPGRNPGEVGAPLKISCVFKKENGILQCWVNGFLQLM